ncbi:MAG: RimK family alpha-L-glutamate ligase [Desulfonatronovibrio sp.]
MENSFQTSRVALGSQLKHCPCVITLGVCPNLSHYPDWKKDLIRQSPKIYFPSSMYAELFTAMGKEIFPSIQTYRFVGDKIKQTLLFQLNRLPVPRTGFYYGPRQQKMINRDFSFPFIAKTPRFSSRGLGVQLIRDRNQLDSYLENNRPAYIQEYLSGCRDYRVVIAGKKIIHSYQRVARNSEFRANVSLGADLRFKNIPEPVTDLALKASKLCGFNYTGIDVCESNGNYYLLEANMKFGTLGFEMAGLDFKKILCSLVQNNEI